MSAETADYVYRITSERNRRLLVREINLQQEKMAKLAGEGREGDSIVCRLIVAGLEAVRDAGEDGITTYSILQAIRAARPPGEHSRGKALARVTVFARQLSDEDYGLAS